MYLVMGTRDGLQLLVLFPSSCCKSITKESPWEKKSPEKSQKNGPTHGKKSQCTYVRTANRLSLGFLQCILHIDWHSIAKCYFLFSLDLYNWITWIPFLFVQKTTHPSPRSRLLSSHFLSHVSSVLESQIKLIIRGKSVRPSWKRTGTTHPRRKMLPTIIPL